MPRNPGISLAVTTCQAGKLILIRADDELANTHFRSFQQPMGLALGSNRLAIGTRYRVRQFINLPASGHRTAFTGTAIGGRLGD